MYAFMSDIHLGSKLSPKDYLKSLDKFIDIIKNHKEKCHCIFVCGDMFDHRLSIEEAKFASIFMINVVCNNCGRDGVVHVPVKFIHGTYTHDYDQYDIFLSILNKIPDVDLFYTKEKCIESLQNGASVLYLPQEYGDIDYSQFLSQKYDIIVGHGPISSETKHPCKSTQYEILHSVEQLGEISKICVFGHYHGFTDFGNNVFYTGPWLRWKYGEDEDRVFFFCNDNFEVEIIPNEFAMKYETFEISSPEQLRTELSKEISNPHRFIIHCSSNDLSEYHAIMNIYKKNKFLKYQIISENNNTLLKNDNERRISNAIVEPVPALIEYVRNKYSIDVSNEINEYERKIKNDNKASNKIKEE